MFCPNCGKNIADGSAFCPECGGAVNSASPVQTVNPAQPESVPVTPSNESFIDKCKSKIEGYLPDDKQKRNYVMIGLSVVMVLVLIFSYLTFTSIEGRWEYDSRTRNGKTIEIDKSEGTEEIEFTGSQMIMYENGEKEGERAYSESDGYIIRGNNRFRYECNGFSLTVYEDDDDDETYNYSRVWEFGFVLKMLILVALFVASLFAVVTVYKSNKLYEASVDTTGYSV